jgi:maltose alpha-D-glucosyltransferase/alpha-amylase
VGSAEQSNTSILYGEDYILKLFRRLQPGENPDVEIGRFLTENAHFPRIPAFLGEIAITPASGEKTTVAMLQGLVLNRGDGWEWFVDQITGMLDRVAGVPAPIGPSQAGFLRDAGPLPEAMAPARASIEAAALLGIRTAEMHVALATPTDNAAFSAEPLTAEDLAQDAERIESQIKTALDALRSQLANLDESTSDAAALLLSRRLELMARARAIASLSPGGQRIRIHGDFHLGQTLRTDEKPGGDKAAQNAEQGDFILLDFEGEPARSLTERRRKQSPLKDVAGMMRSFSYATHFARNRWIGAHAEDATTASPEAVDAWAQLWQSAACAGFVSAYRATVGAHSALMPAIGTSQALLNGYLLEKALYELLYELNNRPAWLRIPISGILSL